MTPKRLAMTATPKTKKWDGLQEILWMAGPIVLGAFSYTIMQFVDQVMVAQLGEDALAAIGSSGLWSYTLSTLILGITGCVATFVAQAYGRGNKEICAKITWQGIHLSIILGALSLLFWPLAEPLFRIMNHSDEVTRMELIYFRIRVLGFLFIAWQAALSSFFQSIGRPIIPMFVAIVANLVNLVLDYGLIFGRLGLPQWGIGGAAVATVISVALQVILLQAIFMNRAVDREYDTRSSYRWDSTYIRDLLRIGFPGGIAHFLDVANWAIFTSFIVGRLGTIQLAAQTAAISFMQLSFIPIIGLGYATTTLVGQWIGREDIPIAKSRAYLAMRIGVTLMVINGTIMAIFGGVLIRVFFSDQPDVISIGRKLLILSAIFGGFDGAGIIAMGALRGAGDTRWIMGATFVGTYFFSLPLAWLLAWPMGLGAVGAWIGATVYIIVLSAVLLHRFHGEKWRGISIFSSGSPSEDTLEKPGAIQEGGK